MRYLSEIETNWKTGTRTVALGLAVLWTGPTEGGKSADVEAISWLLTGSVREYLGRDIVRQPGWHWRSKPAEDKTLWAQGIILDSEDPAVRDVLRVVQDKANGYPTVTLNRQLLGRRNALDAEPYAVQLSVQEIRSNLYGSGQTAARWLAGKLGITTEAVVTEASAHLALQAAKAIEASADGGVSKVDPIECDAADAALKAAVMYEGSALHAVPEEARGALADLVASTKARAKTAKAAVEVVAGITETAVIYTAADLDTADQRVASALALLGDARQEATDAREIMAARSALHTARDTLAQAAPVSDADVQQVAFATATLATIKHALAAMGVEPTVKCWCCDHAVPRGVLVQREARYEAFLAHKGDVVAARDAHRVAVTAHEAAVQAAKALQAALPGLCGSVIAMAWEDGTPAAEAHYQQEVGSREAIRVQMTASGSPQAARDTAASAEKRATRMAMALKAFDTGLRRTVSTQLKAFCVAVNNRLTGDFGAFMLDLRKTEVRFGFDRDGVIAPATGGQEALLLLAMAATLTARARAQGEQTDEAAASALRLATSEDVGIDADTLSAALPGLAGNDVAVYVTSTARGVVAPEGWVVHNLWPDKGAASAATADRIEAMFQRSTSIATEVPLDQMVPGHTYQTQDGKRFRFEGVSLDATQIIAAMDQGAEVRIPSSQAIFALG